MRVVTWNLWWQFGPWEQRQAGIAQVVGEVAPDVLFVQESWGERDSDGVVTSQAANLAGALGHEYIAPTELRFHSRPDFEIDRAFTNAIISRWPLSDMKVTRLPNHDGAPSYRTCVLATADTPSGSVRLLTAHISHVHEPDEDRLAQAARLAKLAGAHPNAILAGDLNVSPDSPEIALLSSAGLTDGWNPDNGDGWTWAETNPHAAGARHPNRRLDYILTGPGLRTTASGLAGTDPVNEIVPSDHYAVWADLTPS
jgi:endonuclease/exonuclease/phosphatase family metal-dependent hydrolase